jgi:aryl carrier-like protein
MSVRAAVLAQVEQVAKEQNRKLAALDDGIELVATGLDSLCFAILVARLEDALGVDPFGSVDGGSYPVTLGDFIKLYENAAR